LVRGARLAVETGKERESFADGEFFGEPSLLQRDAEALAQFAGILLPGLAENSHFAGGGFEKAFEDFDGGGLPCPVRPEQAETFAGGDLQG
jgi:hypothetical protein